MTKRNKDKRFWYILFSLYVRRELNKSQLARELKISRPTLDKLLKEHAAKNKKEHE